MPDIFGKSPQDYKLVSRLNQEGLWDSHTRASAQMTSRSLNADVTSHNFDAIPAGGVVEGSKEHYNRINSLVRNSISTTPGIQYLTSNLEAVTSMVHDTMYQGARYPDLVPIIGPGEIPEGATEYSIRVTDWAAEARRITLQGSESTRVAIRREKKSEPLYYGGITPTWTVQDVRHAAFAGIPLSSELVQMAGIACRNFLDRVAMTGDNSLSGSAGLVNQASADITTKSVTATVGSGNSAVTHTEISDMTGAHLVQFLGNMFDEYTASNHQIVEKLPGDLCLYLAPSDYNKVLREPTSSRIDRPVWDYILQSNSWNARTGRQPMLKSVPELTNRAASDKNRAILALKHRDIFHMAVPFGPRPMEVQQRAHTLSMPFEFAYSELNLVMGTLIWYYNES